MYIGIQDSLRDREGDNAPGYNPLSDVVANLKICSEQRLDKILNELIVQASRIS